MHKLAQCEHYEVQVCRLRCSLGFGFLVKSRMRVSSLGFRVSDSAIRVSGSRFGVDRVSGSGLGVRF